MKKTLNGKTLEQALSEIAVFKKKTKSKMDKFPYYSYSEYFERLVSVLGRDGFSVKYSEAEFVKLPTEQLAVICTCALAIYDENGAVLREEYGVGTKEVERENGGNRRYQHLNNVSYWAMQNAFISVCKSMNMFGQAMMEQGSGESSENASGSESAKSQKGNTSNSGNGGKKLDRLRLYVDQPFVESGRNQQTGEVTYSLLAHCYIDDTRCEQMPSKIIFYPNQYVKCKNSINACMAAALPYEVTIKATLLDTADEGCLRNIVFKGFC